MYWRVHDETTCVQLSGRKFQLFHDFILACLSSTLWCTRWTGGAFLLFPSYEHAEEYYVVPLLLYRHEGWKEHKEKGWRTRRYIAGM